MPTIAVAGHRFLAEVDKVRAGVEVALDRIAAAWPGEPLVAASALAEGADRLVAEQVLARPASRLVVVLPLPRADYRTDFGTAASQRAFFDLLARADEVVELPGDAAAPRAAAYAAGGRAVVERADVLLAVWDGREAQGHGGTAYVVALARRHGLPLAWVHAGNRKPGTDEPTSLGAEQGIVTFHDSLWRAL